MASSVSLLFCLQTIAFLCSGVLQQVDGITDDAVQTKIAITQDTHHLIVQKKSRVLLNCSVTSTPDGGNVRFEWYKGRSQLDVKNFRPWIRLFQNGSLYIRRVKQQHEGLYRCFARNDIGRVIVRNVRLELASMAKNFSVQPLPHDGYVGGVARFECTINTVPPPIFTWQKDSQSLPQEENKYVTLPSGVLQVNQLDESDTGLYRCIVSRGELHNLPDEIDDIEMMHSKEARLKIHTVGRNRRLRVLGSSQNVTVRQGETAILECLVDGRPLPNITWYRFDHEPIRKDYSLQFGQGNLKIFDVQPSDGGVYVCSAKAETSSGLKEFNSYSNLTVHRPPVLKSKFISQKWPTDRIVIFTCNADGNPKPNITWFFNGKHLRSSRSKFQFKSRTTLNIINAGFKQAGYYQCMASNVAGQFIATARLEIYTRSGVPPTPVITEARATSPTSIFLRWELPKPNPKIAILTTAVYFHKVGDKIDSKFAQENSLTLTGLEPYTNYTIEVKSYNSQGGSVSISDRLTVVQTLEGIPEAVPRLKLRSLSSRSIGVEWQPMSAKERQGEITLYKVYHHKKGDVDNTMNVVPGSELSYIIQGLEPDTDYQVIVLAGTKVGFPDLNDDRWNWITHKTPVSDILPAPRLQIRYVNVTCVILTWSIEGDASDIRSYDIMLRNLQNGADVTREVHIASPALKHTLSGLENGSTYEVTVHANGVGAQKFGSVTEEFRTSDGVKYPVPQDLTAEVLDSTTVQLTWDYTEVDSNMLYFTVCYELEVYRGDQKRECQKSEKESIIIDDLEENAKYRFVVTATLDGHDSGESEPYILQTTKDKVPSAPINITYRLLSAEAIELQWKPPAMPNGKITSYIIFYVSNETKQHLWRNVTKPGGLTRSEVKELKAAAYYFKLQACNHAGEGDMSHVLFVRLDNKMAAADLTPETPPKSSKYLAIVIGISIGIVCIIVCCIVVFVFRQRCFKDSDQNCNAPPTFHGNGHLPCHGNGHANQTTNVELKEWEVTPMLSQLLENEQSDSKGGGSLIVTPNGIKVNGLLHSLENGHLPNGHMNLLEGRGHLEGLTNCEEHRGLIAAMLASTDGSQTGDGSESGVNISNISSLSPGVESLEDIDRSGSEQDEDGMRETGVLDDSGLHGSGLHAMHATGSHLPVAGEADIVRYHGSVCADKVSTQGAGNITVETPHDTGCRGRAAPLHPVSKGQQPTTSFSGSTLPSSGRHQTAEDRPVTSSDRLADGPPTPPPPLSQNATISRAANGPQQKHTDVSSTGSLTNPQVRHVHSANSRLPQGKNTHIASNSSVSQEKCTNFTSSAARAASPQGAHRFNATAERPQELSNFSTAGRTPLPQQIPQYCQEESCVCTASESLSIV